MLILSVHRDHVVLLLTFGLCFLWLSIPTVIRFLPHLIYVYNKISNVVLTKYPYFVGWPWSFKISCFSFFEKKKGRFNKHSTPGTDKATARTKSSMYRKGQRFYRRLTLLKIERLRSATCMSTSTCTILTRTRTRFLYSVCWGFHNCNSCDISLTSFNW